MKRKNRPEDKIKSYIQVVQLPTMIRTWTLAIFKEVVNFLIIKLKE